MTFSRGIAGASLLAGVLVAALPGAARAQAATAASTEESVPPVSPRAFQPTERLRQAVGRAAAEAPLVVSGEVLSTRSVPADAGRRIFTLARFRIEARYRGATDEVGELELVIPGGDLGELSQRVAGVPRVSAGDRLLCFLVRRPGPTTPERWEPSALSLSLWRLEGSTAVLEADAVRLETRPGREGEEIAPLRLPLGAVTELLEASGDRP